MSKTLVVEFTREDGIEQFVTANDEMQEIVSHALGIKNTNLTILLTGETGTGKDLLARAIHYTSNRKSKNFVVFTLPTTPEPLIESELFGHKKGAYTGAIEDRRGHLAESDRGTLYLNEIADIDNNVQVKLLRIVEEKEYTRLGETKPNKVDVRIIASTNGDLKRMLDEGKFRKDLYFRLEVCKFHLRPLRERPEDISVLTEHFLKKYSPELELKLDLKIMELFLGYHWPGNVRELENDIKSLIPFIPAEKNLISLELFQNLGLDKKFLKESETERSFAEQVKKFEKELIIKALIKANWVKKEAARILGMPESTLRFKMKQYNITFPA